MRERERIGRRIKEEKISEYKPGRRVEDYLYIYKNANWKRPINPQSVVSTPAYVCISLKSYFIRDNVLADRA
jgi:hypothetical protein